MTEHTMNDDRWAIEIDDLGVRYDGRWVLDGFALQMRRGEKVSLSGPSGSGKSTVLKCVLGLVVPQRGSICVLDRPVDRDGVWEARRNLAYVAQEPDLGPGAARDVIQRPFEYKANADLRGNLDRLPELLERFNMRQALLDKPLSNLSGGEKQRIALVSAILLDRPIVLLDEASSALDQANKQAVVDFFAQAEDLTVLSVSHESEWLDFSSRVVELDPVPAGEGESA